MEMEPRSVTLERGRQQMDADLWLRGLIIGLSVAAPIGPNGVLCIRRTLAGGRRHGYMHGLGAATGHAIFSSIAGCGLTVLSTLLISQHIWLKLISGLFLCYLGFKTYRAIPRERATSPQGKGTRDIYISAVLLTLMNPMTIVSFAALLGGMGMASSPDDYLGVGSLIGGVFFGSAVWWLILSSGVDALRTRFSVQNLHRVNRMSGLVIMAYGMRAFLSVSP